MLSLREDPHVTNHDARRTSRVAQGPERLENRVFHHGARNASWRASANCQTSKNNMTLSALHWHRRLDQGMPSPWPSYRNHLRTGKQVGQAVVRNEEDTQTSSERRKNMGKPTLSSQPFAFEHLRLRTHVSFTRVDCACTGRAVLSHTSCFLCAEEATHGHVQLWKEMGLGPCLSVLFCPTKPLIKRLCWFQIVCVCFCSHCCWALVSDGCLCAWIGVAVLARAPMWSPVRSAWSRL